MTRLSFLDPEPPTVFTCLFNRAATRRVDMAQRASTRGGYLLHRSDVPVVCGALRLAACSSTSRLGDRAVGRGRHSSRNPPNFTTPSSASFLPTGPRPRLRPPPRNLLFSAPESRSSDATPNFVAGSSLRHGDESHCGTLAHLDLRLHTATTGRTGAARGPPPN